MTIVALLLTHARIKELLKRGRGPKDNFGCKGWKRGFAILFCAFNYFDFFFFFGGGGGLGWSVDGFSITLLIGVCDISEYRINACACIIPNMVLLGAHTSKVTFIQALMTQWYWKWCLFEDCEQFCLMASQFMFLAAIFHDSESVGHRLTICTVLADSSHDDNADTFKYLNQMGKNQHAFIYTCTCNRNCTLICNFYNGYMQLYILLLIIVMSNLFRTQGTLTYRLSCLFTLNNIIQTQ